MSFFTAPRNQTLASFADGDGLDDPPLQPICHRRPGRLPPLIGREKNHLMRRCLWLPLTAVCFCACAGASTTGRPVEPASAYSSGPVLPANPLICDFETEADGRIGFEENPEPAQGTAKIVESHAHTGRRSLRVDFSLPPSGAGLFLEPISVGPEDMPKDPWGLEFWCRIDAPHDVWIDIILEETNGETWSLGAFLRTDSGATDWHPVRMSFDWARLVTWNRVDGVLDLRGLKSLRIILKALGEKGAQEGTIWIDSLLLLDASHSAAFRAEGDFTLLNLESVFNSDGVAWKANRTDGDFHTGEWQPRTLPAEFFPKTPEAVFQGVPFRMPPLDDGLDNHIRCNGQRIVGFPPARYSALYFLATGKFGDQIGDLLLEYADGTSAKVALDVSDWSQGAHRGDVAAITFLYTYHENSLEARIPQIFLQSLRADAGRDLVAIRLPMNDYLKVFAITLSRAAHPVEVGALHAKPVAEVDPRYFMPDSVDLDFTGPTRSVGVLGGYLARRNRNYTLDIPTFNGFLTFSSDALSLPHHTLVYDRFDRGPGPFVLGGIQVDGARRGLVKVDFLSSICAAYSCDVTAGSDTQSFKVHLSRAFPAALYDIESPKRYWHDPDRGGSLRVSFAAQNEIRTAVAGEGASPALGGEEPWLLLWHDDPTAVRRFDVPILLVLEKKPAAIHLERDTTRGGWNLWMDHEGEPGRVAAMPLFGIRRLDIHETNAWDGKGLPSSVVGHCREWTRRLQRFPVDLDEESMIDGSVNRITLHDRFTFIELKSDWPVAPLPFAPLPPAAALAAKHGYPVALDRASFDTGVDTFWGPLCGVNDTSTSYSIPVAPYTRTMLVPSAIAHNPVAAEVASELRRLIGRQIPQDLERARFTSDNSGGLAALRVLAPSRLILGSDDRVTSYCRAVVEHALQPANLKLEKEPQTGQFYLMDDRFWAKDAAYDKEWAIGFFLQGLWNYAYYCDDTPFLKRYWNRIAGLYRYYRVVFDWTTSSTYTMATGNGANSDGVRIAWEGMLAMARMARAVGDESLYNDAVVRSSRQMMSLHASWFAVQWAADHDYATERNHRIPPDQAQLRFASDNTWVETITANASHTDDFFQVTHAFYIFNLAHMLYLHDFGLDELRLRKWLFDIVPELHPSWSDGNAFCDGSGRYYGNDHAMAHLIARALLFHQDLAELLRFYRASTEGTRVVKEWYSPMGVAPHALTAMLTGSAPMLILPVEDYRVLENTYDAAARRTRMVLQPHGAASDSIKIRCWGSPPVRAACNGESVAVHYDTATDYATLVLPVLGGKPAAVEVQFP